MYCFGSAGLQRVAFTGVQVLRKKKHISLHEKKGPESRKNEAKCAPLCAAPEALYGMTTIKFKFLTIRLANFPNFWSLGISTENSVF